MGDLAKGGKVEEIWDGYQHRKSSTHMAYFEAKNKDIGFEKTYFWDIIPE